MKYIFKANEDKEKIIKRLGLEGEEIEAEAIDDERTKELGYEEALMIDDKNNNYIRHMLEQICDALRTTTYDIDIEEDEESIRVNLAGEELGCLIGRRGRTLEATERILSVIVNRRGHQRKRLLLDINSYRDKRKEYLKDLANRIAIRTKERGEETVLEPMSARDRRIIHIALKEYPGIETVSIGEEPERKIVIKPADSGSITENEG